MGNGVVRRYRPDSTASNENDAWRKPKARARPKATSGGSIASRQVPSSASRPSSKETAGGGSQSVAAWSVASAAREPAPADDSDDDSDCANLVEAATKVWEELMVRRQSTNNFGALFYIGELKDSVERAARRLDVLRRDAILAGKKVDEKGKELADLCARIEEKATIQQSSGGPVTSALAQWKLGDMAIRRGKGICELSMVHHEADPPYYEVRMAITGTVVGTEGINLVELPGPQKSLVRAAIKEVEKAKTDAAAAEDATLQGEEELKKHHQALTDQVEKKMKDNSAVPTSLPTNSASNSAGPTGGSGRTAPPGLPDMDLVRRWSSQPQGCAGEAGVAAAALEYPDVRGMRENVRGETAPQAEGGVGVATRPAPRPTGAPGAPLGFPSLDELRRFEERAAEKERRDAEQAAAREAPGNRAEAAAPQRQSRRQPQPGQEAPRGQAASAHPVHVPAGFPRIDPSSSGPGMQQQRPQTQQHAQSQQPKPQQSQQQAPHQPQQQGPAAGAAEWVIYRTNQGMPYYHNELTGETVWQLPAGSGYREPATQYTQGTAAWQQDQQQQQQQQQPFNADDPFAHLRRKEEEQRQQREQWTAWYAQYCAWYGQQAHEQCQQPPGATAAPAGAPPFHGASRNQAGPAPQFGTDPHGEGRTKLPPKGPAPPKLDAGFEDHAIYTLKNSVLKEMEAMVTNGTDLAQRKKALRCLQKTWHPDKNADRLQVAKSVFQFIEDTKPWFLHDPTAGEG